MASDPCAEDGCLWFFNFFVYNKKMKRIVFFSCRCTSKSIESNLDDEEDLNDDLILDENSYEYGVDTAAARFYSASSAPINVANRGAVNTVVGYNLKKFTKFFYLIFYLYNIFILLKYFKFHGLECKFHSNQYKSNYYYIV